MEGEKSVTTADEKRGYSKGYQARLKRFKREWSREVVAHRREQFRQQAALVALQQMMLPGNAWGTTKDGQHVPYKTVEEYARGAFKLADEMVKHTTFFGDVFGPGEDPQR